GTGGERPPRVARRAREVAATRPRLGRSPARRAPLPGARGKGVARAVQGPGRCSGRRGQHESSKLRPGTATQRTGGARNIAGDLATISRPITTDSEGK